MNRFSSRSTVLTLKQRSPQPARNIYCMYRYPGTCMYIIVFYQLFYLKNKDSKTHLHVGKHNNNKYIYFI
jgi:hypothetical protein